MLFFYDDVGTGHVTRHQIRGKLDSLETQITHLADRAHQHGLSQSRHTFQEYISARQKCQHDLADDVFLSDNSLCNFLFTCHGVLLAYFIFCHKISSPSVQIFKIIPDDIFHAGRVFSIGNAFVSLFRVIADHGI